MLLRARRGEATKNKERDHCPDALRSDRPRPRPANTLLNARFRTTRLKRSAPTNLSSADGRAVNPDRLNTVGPVWYAAVALLPEAQGDSSASSVQGEVSRWFFLDDYLTDLDRRRSRHDQARGPATSLILDYWGAPLHWADDQGSRWFLDAPAVVALLQELQDRLHGDGYALHLGARPTGDGLSRQRRGDRGDLVTPVAPTATEIERLAAHFEVARGQAGWRVISIQATPTTSDSLNTRVAASKLNNYAAKETTMIIDTADLDPTSSYKLLIGSVLPRAIAWVSTSSTSGVGNIAPVSFFTVVGRFPPVLSITLQPRSDGVTLKDTFVNIRDTGEFVVNIASIGQADAVHRSAHEFDTDVDEFEALGLEKAASEVISAPRIADAPISFECVVDRIIPMPPLPDHVVWGRVKRIHVRDDLYLSRGRIDVGALGVSRSARRRVHPCQQHLHHAAARRAPGRGRLPACRPARRTRHRLLTHRHGRMVTVGLHEGGGEMTQSLNRFRITRTPADAADAPTALLIHGFLDDASVWDGLVDVPGR